MTVYGKVLDETTREPIPGATIYLYNGSVKVASAIATNAGEFTVTTGGYAAAADKLLISSVGYAEKWFSLSDQQVSYLLSRDEKELPPVVVTSGKKSTWLWWVLGAGLLVSIKKKR
jgi:hypothetical protein